MSLVLDASMTIAWLFDDERTPAAHAVMRRVVAEGAIVPSLWRLEVANVLRNAVRRGRCDPAILPPGDFSPGHCASVRCGKQTESQPTEIS
jgi:hypothetical protein